mmetsp:Transcript_14897/g.21065  ORF Transcript_14897/g.21065 Transcript_14897/m.21065 type:complete len:349 (+) Transcript_14897:151-1197(+)
MSRNSRHSRGGQSFLSNARRASRGRGGTTGSIPGYVWMPVVGLTSTVAYSYYVFLDEVPLTKRKRWIATSPEWERQMGDQEYKQLLKQFRYDSKSEILPPNHRASVTVQRVGDRIAEASKTFASKNEKASVSAAPYTYTVIRNDMANAFVLPNNHVFVLTGLFKYVKDEDELAAVLGHEVAHNLARHAGEKISGGLVVNLLARILFLFDPSGVMSMLLLGSNSLLHDLPNSREAESEADQIGIHLAAYACYDPRAAKRVFAAMKAGAERNEKGQLAPPEFLSTHPSHDRRIAQFDDWMPKAMDEFSGDGGERCRHIRREMAVARHMASHSAAEREREQAERLVVDRQW